MVVTDGTGAKTLGRVMEISESSLLLRTKENKRDPSGHKHESWSGAIAGAAIDRTTGNGKVYLAPSGSSARSVTLRPWLHRRGSGVALSMRF